MLASVSHTGFQTPVPKLSALIFCLLFVCGFGAAPESSIPGPSLVGAWKHNASTSGKVVVLRFHADGKFDGTIELKDQGSIRFAGKWEFSAGKIIYAYQKPNAFQDEDKVITLESDYFIIQALDGAQRRYDRIGKSKKSVRP
ncbi:hypothetical protein [Oleiharenicola lentus]|uniref:hypothetical protein n=1 Tax=Oleiharenicola lentus TaxID=2508720 RepID=UPI003F680A1E